MYWKFIIEQEIAYVTTQTVIEDPVGWSEAVFNFTRDRDLHGVFFQYVATLKFYGEAYDLINTEYLLNGVDGEMRLIIQFACSDTDPFEDFYVSKLNFSRIEFENSEVCLVSIPIEDDTALTLFKNRQDQRVDLASLTSFDGEALDDYSLPLNIPLAPKTFIINTSFDQNQDSTVDWTDVITVPGAGTVFSAYSTRFVQLGFNNIIVDETGVSNNSFVAYNTQAEVIPILIADRYGIYDIDINISVRADFGANGDDLEILPGGMTPAGMDSFLVEIFISFNNGTPFSLGGFSVTQDPTGWGPNTTCDPPDSTNYTTFNLSYINTQIMNAGDEIRIWAQVAHGTFQLRNTTGVNQDYNLCTRFTFYDSSGLHLNWFRAALSTNNGTTLCDGVLVNEALSRTAEAITNDELRVYSEYFGRTDSLPYSTVSDGDGSLEFLTNGLKIRQRVAPLLFSFKDLYDALRAIHNIGMGLEDDNNYGRPVDSQMIRIEPARYFYDDEIILICDKVPSITRRVLAEEHYSIFKGGYAKWEAEEFNGLDEFATKRNYRTTLKSVKSTLTQICNFIASGYAIEFTKGKGRNTDDWRFDNDNFIICVVRSYADYVVEQGNISSPANLIDPATVINFRISPNRNLLRWLWKILTSYADPLTGEVLFMDGEGNYLAEGEMPDSVEAAVLSESESPITDSTMQVPADGLPVYVPEQWVFEYPMSVDDYHAVKANPRGLISVRYGQNTTFVNCFIRQIEYKPVKGLAQFTLLPKYPFGVGPETWYLLQETGFPILQENGDHIILEH